MTAREKLVKLLIEKYGRTQAKAEIKADELIGELRADAGIKPRLEQVKRRVKQKAGLK